VSGQTRLFLLCPRLSEDQERLAFGLHRLFAIRTQRPAVEAQTFDQAHPRMGFAATLTTAEAQVLR